MRDADLFYELSRLQADYWHEVDHNHGRRATDFYTEDGVFVVGGQRMSGPAEIRAFYAWREQRGVRTARHVFANGRLGRAAAPDHARFECIMMLYAGDGPPVLPSEPPIMTADISDDCVLRDGRWLFRSHVLTPVFVGGAPATVPTPEQLAQHTLARDAGAPA